MSAAAARVFMISGFLGAGKTTLLRRIIAWKQDMSDTVVIVNEFGDIGIDGDMVKSENGSGPGGIGDGGLIELTTGCICCTLKVDLRLLLEKLWERGVPRWIFIEASGVSDPLSLIGLFHEEGLVEHVDSLQTVTVLDAETWKMREIMGQLFYLQLGAADLLILNKTDLLDPHELPAIVREIREHLPHAEIVPATHCRIDLDQALQRAAAVPAGPVPGVLVHGPSAADHGLQAFSFRTDGLLAEGCLREFMDSLPVNIFRVKGTVRFADRTVLVNRVGPRCTVVDAGGPAPDSRLAFVAWGAVNAEPVLETLRRCLISAAP